jgi:hypothetical protein
MNSEPQVGNAQTTYESEMALFFECMPQCAQKVFDTADIVRDRDISPRETTPGGGGSDNFRIPENP